MFRTSLTVAVFLVPGLALAQETKPIKKVQPVEAAASEVDVAKIMAETMRLATPGAEHKELAAMAGSWDAAMKMRMSPDAPWEEQKGKTTFKTILGGRYVLQELSATVMGMPMEGMQLLGYDNLKKCYTSTWHDTWSTWSSSMTGKKDDTGKVIYTGTMFDVVTPKGRPYKAICAFPSADKMVFSMFDTIEAKEVKVMEITYTRAMKK